MSEREFLFEYRFDGAVYGLPVSAQSIEDARRKVSAMALASYKGEIAATIPASLGGIIQRVAKLMRSR